MQLVVDSGRELAGQAGTGLRQARADVKNAALRLGELALDHRRVRGRGRQLLHVPARQVCPRQQGLDVAGTPTQRVLDGRATGVDLGQTLRIGVEP